MKIYANFAYRNSPYSFSKYAATRLQNGVWCSSTLFCTLYRQLFFLKRKAENFAPRYNVYIELPSRWSTAVN